MESCDNGNGNSVVINGNKVIINWVLYPIVTVTAATNISFAVTAVSLNEPFGLQNVRDLNGTDQTLVRDDTFRLTYPNVRSEIVCFVF